MVVFLFLVLVGTVVSAEQSSHLCPNKTCIYGVTCIADKKEHGVCDCMRGFSGDNCSDTNECKNGQGDPCGHRGVCQNTVGSYKCNCLDGWNGIHCQTLQNITGDPPCMPGYSGKHCKVSACGHGYAVNASKSFKCYCDAGWTHLHKNDLCLDDIDECTTNVHVCQNGGNCTNTNGSYICACLKPWDGQNCSHYNTCLLNPCQNEGSCTMIENNASITYICSCKNSWQGSNCSDDVDECSPKFTGKCYHGNCTNYPGSYKCSCVDGWLGRNCNDSIFSSTNTFTHIPTTVVDVFSSSGTSLNVLATYTIKSSSPQQKNRTSESAAAATTDKPSQHVSVIVGATVGALAFVVVGCLVGYLLYKRKRMQIASMEVPVETSGGEKQDK